MVDKAILIVDTVYRVIYAPCYFRSSSLANGFTGMSLKIEVEGKKR